MLIENWTKAGCKLAADFLVATFSCNRTYKSNPVFGIMMEDADDFICLTALITSSSSAATLSAKKKRKHSVVFKIYLRERQVCGVCSTLLVPPRTGI